MAQNQSPALFAVALLLFAAAPLALAQVPLLNFLNINGSLCCNTTGSCSGGGTPLVGVPVTLVCRVAGVNTTVGQGITGVGGTFNFTLGNGLLSQLLAGLASILEIIRGPFPCTVNATLPISGVVCPVLNVTNATLSGVPTVVGILFSPITGLFGNATVLSFQVRVGVST